MSTNTSIEWTDRTWNPTLGCRKVSLGCDSCYAIGQARLRAGNPNPKIAKAFADLTVRTEAGVDWNGRVNFLPERLRQPLTWRKPARVFVNSLSDLFYDKISADEVAQIFAVMSLADQHVFQVLTKRPGRMRSLLTNPDFTALVDEHRERIKPGCGPMVWPIPGVWLGVSAENQKWLDVRLGPLLTTPAAVRFLSCEPLIGPVSLQPDDHTGHERDYDGGPEGGYWMCLDCGDSDGDREVEWTTQEFPDGLNWIIAGGESGSGARPMHPDWARTLRDQCEKAGVPFFMKQHGAYVPVTDQPKLGDVWVAPDGSTRLWDYDGDGRTKTRLGEWRTGPQGAESALVRRVGKKAAGRELDGREWSEFPRAVTG